MRPVRSPRDALPRAGRSTTATALLLLWIPLFLAACADKPKGACVIGTGVSRSCGDDVTDSECDYLGGSFHEGQTCGDLGYASQSLHGPGPGTGLLDVVFRTTTDEEPSTSVGLGTAIRFQSASPRSVRGWTPIRLRVGAIADRNGRSLPDLYGAACPGAPGMPAVLAVSSDGWLFSPAATGRQQVIFDASTPDREAVLTLTAAADPGPNAPDTGHGLLTGWSFTGGDRASGHRCTYGQETGIAVAWQLDSGTP